MPYEWSNPTGTPETTQLALWPYRSLPRRGFALFILVTAGMVSIPLFLLLGSVALWGVLPFMALAVAGVWWGLQRSYHSGEIREVLTIGPTEIELTRTNPSGDTQNWRCNAHWVQVFLHPTGGPVAHYITLRGKGREVELGAFLSEDERKVLYGDLRAACRAGRHA